MVNMISAVSSYESVGAVPSQLTKAPQGALSPAKSGGFQGYLMDALNYVNDKQQAVSQLQEQALVDPDSVNVDDITSAMAMADLTMSAAQQVISRVTNAWGEITTTR
jgi:flagellar hook-basal body complex protein FliE